MQSIYSLYMLVDKYATEIEKMNLDGDELKEYGTVLLHLQSQVENGEPSERIVSQCLEFLRRFSPTLPSPVHPSTAVAVS